MEVVVVKRQYGTTAMDESHMWHAHQRAVPLTEEVVVDRITTWARTP